MMVWGDICLIVGGYVMLNYLPEVRFVTIVDFAGAYPCDRQFLRFCPLLS